MLAVMNGHRDSVMLLLEQSANPNAVDINKRTAAHRGVRKIAVLLFNDISIISILKCLVSGIYFSCFL